MTEDNSIDSHIFKEIARIKAKNYEKGRNWLYQKKALAEFTYWAKMPTWTYLETALLINDIDPRANLKFDKYVAQVYPQVKDYRADVSILDRAVKAGQVSYQDEPVKMINAVQRLQLDVPTDLTDYVLEHAQAVLEYDEKQAKRESDAAAKNAEMSKANSERIERAYNTASVTRKNSEAKDKKRKEEKQVGEQKLENVYAITGLLIKVLKEKGFSQKSLRERFTTFYDETDEKNAQKGLKQTTVDEVFSASNKAFKHLNKPEDDF